MRIIGKIVYVRKTNDYVTDKLETGICNFISDKNNNNVRKTHTLINGVSYILCVKLDDVIVTRLIRIRNKLKSTIVHKSDVIGLGDEPFEKTISRVKLYTERYRYGYRTDIKAAFARIDLTKVFDLLNRLNCLCKDDFDFVRRVYLEGDYEFSGKTTKIRAEYKELYPGIPLSNYLFSLCMSDMFDRHGISRFVNYVDDIMLFDNDEGRLCATISRLETAIREYGLDVNNSKTYKFDTQTCSVTFMNRVIVSRNDYRERGLVNKYVINNKLRKYPKFFCGFINLGPYKIDNTAEVMIQQDKDWQTYMKYRQELV